jgi:hypothetical protein
MLEALKEFWSDLCELGRDIVEEFKRLERDYWADKDDE